MKKELYFPDKKKILIFYLLSVYFVLTGFFSLDQTGQIKNDGSGSLSIVYSGTIKEVEDSKYSLGHFPFGKDNVSNNFSSENVTVKRLQIAKPGDSVYMVILELDFKNILDLNELKGFSDMKVNLNKADKGTQFKWTISSNERTRLLNVLNVHLTFESEIDTSNGTISGKSVKWHKTDFSKDLDLSVILKSDFTAPGNKVSKEKETDKNDNENSNKNVDNKPCGVFGMELPLILLTGLVFFTGREGKS